jgi:hypothetical protein
MRLHVVEELLASVDKNWGCSDDKGVQEVVHYLSAAVKRVRALTCHDPVLRELHVVVDNVFGHESSEILCILLDLYLFVHQGLLTGQKLHDLEVEVLV